jgi:hypothetical protein
VISGDVISAEAPPSSARQREDRARIAQTIPGQSRSNPMAAPAPFTAPVIASAKPAPSTLDDTYPPLKARGSKLPLVIGGLALVAAGGIVVAKLSSSAETAEATSSRAASLEAPVAPTSPTTEPTPAVAAAPAEAPRPSQPAEPPAPKAEVAEAAPAPEPPAKRTKVTRKVSAPAPRRPTARSEPKAPSSPAAEPAPAPAPKPAKGVIVRETPF